VSGDRERPLDKDRPCVTRPPLDLAIIGGGIAGLIHLHYARARASAPWCSSEKAVSGACGDGSPRGRTFRSPQADFVVGDLVLAGPMQPQVLAYVESWVERFALADGIRVDSPVHRARHTGSCWELDTPAGTVRARHLVAATGGHNKPTIPAVARRDSTIREYHSSALRDPGMLKDRHVMVVGGGASAFDLLDLCLAQGARRIAWVHRDVRWFAPTRKPKAIAGSTRPFARLQAEGLSVAAQSAAIGADLSGRYAKFGIEAIQPPRSLDLRRDQLIPGRARMLADFGALERHPGTTVESIAGGEVTLADGTRLAPDIVLWGTGYEIDLSYFEDVRIASIRNVGELGARCACVFRSVDAPDLYFPGRRPRRHRPPVMGLRADGALDHVAHPGHGAARHGAAPPPQPSRDRVPRRRARPRQPRRGAGLGLLPRPRAAHPGRRALPDALTARTCGRGTLASHAFRPDAALERRPADQTVVGGQVVTRAVVATAHAAVG
jgi:cation diffusion facilitator CzcD-associated flavoprotein CzcO